ncbi:hypothetical protein [Stenotrophomonas pavanii]|uniref:hypothetical protein n=1 Tax=Stenotrophomonas pavanii TaxID=487698 RepID=UPI0039C74F55
MEIECLEVDQREVVIEAGASDGADGFLAVILDWMAASDGLKRQAWIVGDYDIPEVALSDSCPIGLRDF